MNTKQIMIAGVAVLAAVATNNARAVPITGNIGFTGEAVVNSAQASTATMVTQWNATQIIGKPSGSFAASGLTQFETAIFSAPWLFNDTTPISRFWSVGGFTFALASSLIDPTGTGGIAGHSSIKVDVNGSVTGNGYTATAFSGTLTFADPNDGSGPDAFTAQWSFTPVNSVPDGANTLTLLGLTTLGLVLINRKYRQVLVMSQKTGIA
jgi:hypothetical protein